MNATVIYVLYFPRSTFTFTQIHERLPVKGFTYFYFLRSPNLVFYPYILVCPPPPPPPKRLGPYNDLQPSAPEPIRSAATFSLLGDAASAALTQTGQMLKHTHTHTHSSENVLHFVWKINLILSRFFKWHNKLLSFYQFKKYYKIQIAQFMHLFCGCDMTSNDTIFNTNQSL